MAAFETIDVAIDSGVAVVTLDRPHVLNAYSVRMRDELWEIFTNLAQDADLRALVVRGRGRAFCAGADLTEFGTAPSPFEARRIRFQRDVWSAIRDFPVPTVAALHGHTIGTGFELALHCTFRIAARSTTVRMPEARLGVLPGAGATQTIPRYASSFLAGRLLYLGEPLDAAQLSAAGLVDAVVADERLDPAVDDLVACIVELPSQVGKALLGVLRTSDERSVDDCVEFERYVGNQLQAARCGQRG
jgi:enoyl-CoA hydratase/carnithine racemase